MGRIAKQPAIEMLMKCQRQLPESVIQETWSVSATEEHADEAEDETGSMPS
jgi:hypothetical protein